MCVFEKHALPQRHVVIVSVMVHVVIYTNHYNALEIAIEPGPSAIVASMQFTKKINRMDSTDYLAKDCCINTPLRQLTRPRIPSCRSMTHKQFLKHGTPLDWCHFNLLLKFNM